MQKMIIRSKMKLKNVWFWKNDSAVKVSLKGLKQVHFWGELSL